MKKGPSLRNTIIWKNEMLWMKATFLHLLLFLFSPSQVPICSFDSLGLKLGHSPEKHLDSSPFVCSYLFIESVSPSKEVTKRCSAAVQKGLCQSLLLEEDWAEPIAPTSERSPLCCTGCRERQRRTSPMVQRKIGHVPQNKQLLLWGGKKKP